MARRSRNKPRPPLDDHSLSELALHYLGRYATTRAKLVRYLKRKIAERGWDDEDEPRLEALADHMAELGYVDDRGFAKMRAASLIRRGYGSRRLDSVLFADGVNEADGKAAREMARRSAWDSAEAFAKKRRIGPFSAERLDRDARRKAFAAMMRAGHDIDLVKKFVDAEPGVPPDRDD